MQQRYYEPIAGRFLSVDPVTTDAKTGGNFNRYAYVNDNPYRYTDPTGELPEAVEKLNEMIVGPYGKLADQAISQGNYLAGAGYTLAGAAFGVGNVLTLGQGAATVRLGTVGAAKLGESASLKGTATILQDGRHVSVAVRHGDNVLHTEQVILGNGSTTIAKQTGASGTTGSLTVSLPNAKAAMDYQRSVLGANAGAYNLSTNSCLTHCGDVLRAGGVANVPSTTSGLMRWLRSLGE